MDSWRRSKPQLFMPPLLSVITWLSHRNPGDARTQHEGWTRGSQDMPVFHTELGGPLNARFS